MFKLGKIHTCIYSQVTLSNSHFKEKTNTGVTSSNESCKGYHVPLIYFQSQNIQIIVKDE